METLIDRLRAATTSDHQRLEQALGLLEPPLSRSKFEFALIGFHAFHHAWEPEVEALVDDPDFMIPRRKTELAARDMEVLGVAPLATVEANVSFLTSPSRAWGSLYVMEGSSLGGQVISKALRDAPWAPEGGLVYFSPYGGQAGAMWRTFRARLEAESGSLDVEAVFEGARITFAEVRKMCAPPSAGAGSRRPD